MAVSSGWCATRAATTPATRWCCPTGENFALHLIPSGILTPGVTNVIGNGVVVDPGVLLTELNGLEERGVDTERLLISADAHLLMPYHVAIDKVTERYAGNKKIGTTGRGIGPCYQDKIARIGIRVADVLDPGLLTEKIEAALEFKNQVLVKIYNRKALDPTEVRRQRCWRRPRVSSTASPTPGYLLNTALDKGETVLLEGSQGTLLDVDHGTYPYVTSSNPTAGGARVGSGYRPDPHHHGAGNPQGVHHPGRLGSVPHRAVRRVRRVPVEDRRRGRCHDGPAPALRLVRRGDRPLRDPGQRHHRLLPDQARRAVQPGDGAGVRRLHASTASASTRCR